MSTVADRLIAAHEAHRAAIAAYNASKTPEDWMRLDVMTGYPRPSAEARAGQVLVEEAEGDLHRAIAMMLNTVLNVSDEIREEWRPVCEQLLLASTMDRVR